jgi:hypothetical protein
MPCPTHATYSAQRDVLRELWKRGGGGVFSSCP